MDPVSLAIAATAASAASTVGSTIATASAARAQNQAIERSMRSQRRAAQVRQQQLSEQAALEKQKTIDEVRQIVGRTRVSAGESGISFRGSPQALARQATFDAQENLNILDQNFRNLDARVRSGLEVDLNRLASKARSPMLEAFQTAAAGATQTLRLGANAGMIRRQQQQGGG